MQPDSYMYTWHKENTIVPKQTQVFTERLSVLGLQLNSELLAVEMMYSWSDTENIFVVTYGLVLLCGY